MMSKEEVPAVILSGGESRRMGRNDKAFLSIEDKTLLEITVERLHRQTQQIAINTNSNDPKYFAYNLPVLNDAISGFLGPLAGIFTAMKWANQMEYKIVATIAVDTPLFPENLLKKLHCKMEISNSDIVFAASSTDYKKKKLLHPVFGLWKTSLYNDLRKELESGVRKVTHWSERHKASDVFFQDKSLDPFFNVNTPEDIIILREHYRKK